MTGIPLGGILKNMTNSIQQKLIRRLKIIEGQVRGLQSMVNDGAYCVDVITQANALKKAISSVEDAVLENHLATHVVEQIKSGQHAKAIHEVMKVYKLSKKDK